MADTNTSYPYPVLGNQDDFPGSEFTLVAVDDPTIGEGAVSFDFSVQITSKFLADLLANGLASIVAEVTCRDTYFNGVYTFKTQECSVSLSKTNVRGVVGVRTWLVANEDIHEYAPQGIHNQYGGAKFFVERGDVLGEGQSFWFIVDDQPVHHRNSSASFIVVGPGPEGEGPADVSFDADGGKIIIAVRANDYAKYKWVSEDPDAKNILHASLILPVLIQGLLAFKDPDNFGDFYNPNLEQYLKLNNITDLDNPLLIAQEILKNPVTRSLEGAFAKLTTPEEDEE